MDKPVETISNRIRGLARAGHSRADIARLVDRSYQQVRQVLVSDEMRKRRIDSTVTSSAPSAMSGAGMQEPVAAGYDAGLMSLPARLEVDRQSRVQLPPAWAVAPGQVFIARKFGMSIVLMDVANASEAARTGERLESAVDDLIAERRLEAMREFDD